MRRVVMTGIVGLLSVLLGCAKPPAIDRREIAPPPRPRPNIVLVIADQWRAQDVGYNGNREVRTPNIDRLAGEGANFAMAVANTPVCAPTRASLLTGRYATQHGVFYNDRPLAESAVTLAEVLKGAGYRTGLIGKWHLDGSPQPAQPSVAAQAESREHPIARARRQGFDFWKAAEATHDYWNSVYFDENDRRLVWPGYDAAAQTEAAKRYIAANRDSPFFLTLSWGPPHDPYETAPPRERALYEDAAIALRPNVPPAMADKAREAIRGYYAHIAALDRYVGDLQRFIDESGVGRDTIFIFTSDHGDMLFSQGEQLKQKPWDESIRVPFLLRYPARVRPGTVIRTPFSSPDVMPTLLALTGVAIPESVAGLDFSGALRGDPAVDRAGALLMLPTPFGNWNFANGGRAYRGIRTERHTYVVDRNGPWLLYDNERDPYQRRNLVGDPALAPLRARLTREIDAQRAAIGDRFEAPQCYMDAWGYRWNPRDRPTDPADARCPRASR